MLWFGHGGFSWLLMNLLGPSLAVKVITKQTERLQRKSGSLVHPAHDNYLVLKSPQVISDGLQVKQTSLFSARLKVILHVRPQSLVDSAGLQQAARQGDGAE